MKNLFLVFISIAITIAIQSQENFIWKNIKDVDKTQSQIYKDTKIFISNTWKSANDVIQMDDKDAGIIIVKGSTIKKVSHSLNTWTYIYNYTVTFKMKDGKYNFSIDNIHCAKAYPKPGTQYVVSPLQPFDGEYDRYKNVRNKNRELTLPENKALQLMDELKSDFNRIHLSYINHIDQLSELDEDW